MGKRLFFFIVIMLIAMGGRSFAANSAQNHDIPAKEDLFEGFIYYADSQKTFLTSIKRRFASTLDSHGLGLEIINALIQGPGVSHLEPTWPKEVQVNSFFITDDKKAYVDLNITPQMVTHMDTRAELLAIYSLVNSLTVNIPKIKMVKILIQGKDALTLAGHIDLEYFYKTNMLIVK